jgi:hypothetical protein
MLEQPINAAPQTDLFGNQLPEGHVAKDYSAEAAAKDTEDLRLLVGRVLVETAVKINDEDVAKQLTGDAQRYMAAWNMQMQFNDLMRRQIFDEAHLRAEEDSEEADKPTSKKSMRLPLDLQKPGRHGATRPGSPRSDPRRPGRTRSARRSTPASSLVKS